MLKVKNRFVKSSITAAMLLLFCGKVFANQDKPCPGCETYEDWHIVKGQSKNFIFSRPVSSTGTYKKRSKPYLMVVKSGKDINIMLYSGYTFKSGSKVKASIALSYSDASKVENHKLFTRAEQAWFESKERHIANVMKNAASVTFDAISHKSTTSKDVYSLKGFTQAYQALMAS